MSPERRNPEEFSFEKTARKIKERFAEDIELVRELSRIQVATWKKVPYWALMSAGGINSGFNQPLAYEDGLWVLRNSREGGYFQNAIDLDNGEIVQMRDPRKLASQTDVMRLALHGLEQFGAAKILNSLILDADRSASSRDSRSSQIFTEWCNERIQKFNIQEVYIRERVITAEEMSHRTAAALASDLVG